MRECGGGREKRGSRVGRMEGGGIARVNLIHCLGGGGGGGFKWRVAERYFSVILASF